MEHNKAYQVNWKTINVPSVTAVVALGITLFIQYGNFQREQERTNLRIDTIEASREAAIRAYEKQMDFMTAALKLVQDQSNKNEYRLTVVEQGLISLGQRQDRFADALGDLRDGLAKINTSIEVLTERVETALPVKKSALAFQPTPPEYRR